MHLGGVFQLSPTFFPLSFSDIHANGIYFGVYEYILRTFSPGKRCVQIHHGGYEKVIIPCRREDLNPALIVFAGGTAGMSFWVAAIVPDTLKSILQTG